VPPSDEALAPERPGKKKRSVATAPGLSCSPVLPAWTRSTAPSARDACGSSPSSRTQPASHATSPRSVSRRSCPHARPAEALPIGRAASCAGWPQATTLPERLGRRAPPDAPRSVTASPGPGEGLSLGPFVAQSRPLGSSPGSFSGTGGALASAPQSPPPAGGVGDRTMLVLPMRRLSREQP
jgi:hypothetical protein